MAARHTLNALPCSYLGPGPGWGLQPEGVHREDWWGWEVWLELGVLAHLVLKSLLCHPRGEDESGYPGLSVSLQCQDAKKFGGAEEREGGRVKQ